MAQRRPRRKKRPTMMTTGCREHPATHHYSLSFLRPHVTAPASARDGFRVRTRWLPRPHVIHPAPARDLSRTRSIKTPTWSPECNYCGQLCKKMVLNEKKLQKDDAPIKTFTYLCPRLSESCDVLVSQMRSAKPHHQDSRAPVPYIIIHIQRSYTKLIHPFYSLNFLSI